MNLNLIKKTRRMAFDFCDGQVKFVVFDGSRFSYTNKMFCAYSQKKQIENILQHLHGT